MTVGAFQQFGRLIDNQRYPIALVIGAVRLVFFTELSSWLAEESWYWRVGGGAGMLATVGCSWYGYSGQHSLTKKNGQLQSENDELRDLVMGFGSDYFDIWDKRLQVLAEDLGFDARDRISVYRHESNCFTMVGRFALLPELDRPGRSVYPVDEGVIGAAWRAGDGKCVVQDLPDPGTAPEAYRQQNQEQWAIPLEVIDGMNMKARSIAAFALNNQQNSTRHAIIVFESTESSRFDVDEIEKRVRGSAGKEIIHLLEIMQNREPSLGFAKAKGF